MYAPKISEMFLQLVLGATVFIILLQLYMSLRYQYDWMGGAVRKATHRPHWQGQSVTDLLPIPAVPYMDRIGEWTKVPRMKHNSY